MFGRKRSEPNEPLATEQQQDRPAAADPRAPKGRPTPSRRESEAARRQARRIPADPKAARKAAKERARQEREVARAGMLAGDERYLPARDKGPVRAFARDWIDRRRRLSEFFIFVALGILFAGFIPDPRAQVFVSSLWFAVTLMVAAEIALTAVGLHRALRQRWPDKADRKGAVFYGSMRALQIRKLRVPAPRTSPGKD